MRAAIQVRLSQEDADKPGNDQALSLTNQRTDATRYAATHGHTIVTTYDEGIGKSWNIQDRPEFLRLKQDLFADKWDVLITKDDSRLCRDIIEFVALCQDAKALGKAIIGYATGIDYTANLTMSTFQASISRYHIEKGRQENDRMIRRKKEQHLPYNRAPRGYTNAVHDPNTPQQTKTWDIDPTQASIVKDIFDLAAQGHTVPDIRRAIEQQHGTSIYDIRSIIRNTAYIGIRRVTHTIRGAGDKIISVKHDTYRIDVPLFIDKTLFQKANRELNKTGYKRRWENA